MWPFSPSSDNQTLDEDIDEATRFAADQWAAFRKAGSVPDNLGLKLQLGQFAPEFERQLAKRMPSLKSAPTQLMLLIMAEGVAASGHLSRPSIERQLGITLPDRPIIDPADR